MTQRRTRETELAETPSAVADARRMLRELMWDGGGRGDTELRAELALSEIVTNALTHGRPPVCLRVSVDPGRVTVTVTDSGVTPMHLRAAHLDDVHGRGLAIVAAVVTAWGWERPPGGGRVVWFTVAEPQASVYRGLVPCA